MTTKITGVYFDFFGTLVDNRSIISSVWSKIAKRLGVEISPDDSRIWEGVRKQWKEFDEACKQVEKEGGTLELLFDNSNLSKEIREIFS